MLESEDLDTFICQSILKLLTFKCFVTNFIVCLLHVLMLKERIKVGHVLSSFVLQEVVVLLIGIFCPLDSPVNLIYLWISISVFERVRGEKVEVKDGFSFVSDLPCQYFKDNELVGTSTESGTLKTDLKCLILLKQASHVPEGSLPLDLICSVNSEVLKDQLLINLDKMGFDAENCFQVTTSEEEGMQCVDLALVADNPGLKDRWVKILKTWVGLMDEEVQKIWLKKLLKVEEEEAKDKTFNVDDAFDLTSQSGRSYNPIYLLNLFESFSESSHKSQQLLGSIRSKFLKDEKMDSKVILEWNKFVEFFKSVITPAEIENIFNKIPGKRKKVNILPGKAFQNFLRDVQKETEQANEYLEEINNIEPVLQYSNVSVVGLSNYLLEEDHSIFNHKIRDCMDYPLSHYYIASSHNTYLTKDQLKSKSSVDMYIKALERGCKCLELDCWDGPDNEPVIYHGYTLTSKILFKDVIVAIKENAFIRSLYPVILSFEIHCSIEQQKVMVRHLKEILGDMLYLKTIPGDECDLPSPNDLKGYILVKAKKISDGLDEGFIEELDGELSDDDVEMTESNILKELSETKDSDCSDIISTGSISDEDEINLKDKKRNKLQALLNEMPVNTTQKTKKTKIARELSDLVVYCQAKRFRNFYRSKIEDGHYEMFSLQEKKALKLMKDASNDFIRHNTRHLTRIYPSGHRIDSSNYNPVHLWNVGCQLVALNYQTACKEMQINQALFQINDFSGYVLKPDILRDEDNSFDPHAVPKHFETISIRIISGHQFPFKCSNSVKSERNYVVQMRIFGIEADCQMQQTSPVKNNGLNPAWDEVFFFNIHVPQLAILMFTVCSKTFVAQYALPVRSLNRGCRRVPLLNKHSEVIKESFLLVHVEQHI